MLILFGVFAIAWTAGGDAINSSQSIGHALFLASALAWAFYTVAMRRARLDGLHAAGIAAVGALVLYLPVYLMAAGTSLASAPWGDVALQAFVQGILTAIVSLIFYGRAVGILGASSGAAFRGAVPGDDRGDGDPGSRRVADGDGLDCHHRHFDRRLRRERRAAAATAELKPRREPWPLADYQSPFHLLSYFVVI